MCHILISVFLTHPHTRVNLTQLWKDSSIWEWPLKQNIRPSFHLILKLSNALDGLLSVLSRLHGRKHKCVFASLNVTTIIYCCLEASRSGFFLAWNSLFIFRYRCCNRHFAGFSKTYFLDFRLPLLWFCLLIVLRALVHLI